MLWKRLNQNDNYQNNTTTKIKNDDMWQDGDVGDNSGGSHFAFISVSNQHVVHLKFILCYLSIINQ